MVERTRDPIASRLLDDFLARTNVEIMSVTTDQALFKGDDFTHTDIMAAL